MLEDKQTSAHPLGEASPGAGRDEAPAPRPPSPFQPADISVVRVGRPEDEEQVMRLARMIHGEIGLFTINEDKVRTIVRRCLNLDRGLIGVIGEKDLHGCILLSVQQMYYTDDNHLCELFFFVDPEHRRSIYAKSLIAWAKDVSDKTGMALVIGVFNNKRTAAKVRLCEKQLEPSGSLFLHNRKFGTFEPSHEESAS